MDWQSPEPPLPDPDEMLREAGGTREEFEPGAEPSGAAAEEGGRFQDDGRPIVKCVAGQLDRMATEAEAALLHSGAELYQRTHELVRPVTREVPASKGRMTLAAGFATLAMPGLVDELCKVAQFVRFDMKQGQWVATNPPPLMAGVLLAREGRWHLPPIAGVVTTPTLRPDGTLLTAAGYDAATRLYHAADPTLQLTAAATKPKPTRADALAALDLLCELLGEFPFVPSGPDEKAPKGVSRAVALSGCITPVVRGALMVAPMHAYRASTAGTGKSYLADVASAIATGRPCPVATVAPEEAETEKRLTGLMLAGFALVSLDNVNGELGGDLLAQATERPLVRIRPLGTSKIVEIENRATLFATGNNLRVRGDMVRRVLISDLDAGLERPELRQFASDPVATVLKNRGAFVSAGLVIVRAYLAAEQPGLLPVLQSYEDWSGLVRSALVWLGCDDPVASMEQARADDPELSALREMLALWHEAFGSDGVTLNEVAKVTTKVSPTAMGVAKDDTAHLKHPDFADALLRLAGDRGQVSTRRLSGWLRGRANRIVEGKKFQRAGGGHGNVDRWQVASTREPPKAPPASAEQTW